MISEEPTSRAGDDVIKSCCETDNLRALWGLFTLNTAFAVTQLIGAYLANSLSMVSDSSSMLVDSFAYLANIILERRKHILGAKRTKFWEVITSVSSVGLLVIVTIVAIVDASDRLKHRQDDERKEVNGRLVFGFAVGNFALDIVMCGNYFYQLRNRPREATLRAQISHEARDELNMVSAFVHLFADTLRTLTSMVAGLLEDRLKDQAVTIDSVATYIVCAAILLAASFVYYEAGVQYREYKAHPENMENVAPEVSSDYTAIEEEA